MKAIVYEKYGSPKFFSSRGRKTTPKDNVWLEQEQGVYLLTNKG